MTAKVCPDCGETITYRSCQQPNTDGIAELALVVHRMFVHGDDGEALDSDLAERAIVEALDARDRRAES